MNENERAEDRDRESTRRPWWWVVAGGAVAVAFVASVVLSTRSSPTPAGPPGSMAGMSMAAGSPGAADRMRIAANLRAIGKGCPVPDASDRARQLAVVSAARTLVDFQRRYPHQRFRLERGGEAGSMLSVLLVARYEARSCSAAAVGVIDRALPARVRAALPPSMAADNRRRR